MWSDASTELKVMRADVARFIDERGWSRYHAPVNVASAAAVEAGELLELFQWRRPSDPVPDDVADEAGYELADVLHYTFCLVNAADLVLPSDGMTFSQVLAVSPEGDLTPKQAAEEVMVGASLLLMAARASTATEGVARSPGGAGPQDELEVSVNVLLEAVARCARTLGQDLSARLYAKNRLNEERFPVGTMPDVGY